MNIAKINNICLNPNNDDKMHCEELYYLYREFSNNLEYIKKHNILKNIAFSYHMIHTSGDVVKWKRLSNRIDINKPNSIQDLERLIS
jgi:hypothetical protein